LQNRLQTGPLALDTIIHLLEQIGAALHLAHRSGVVHRDIKPANILLDEDGNGYLTDFGIAKNLNLEDQTRTGEVIGSPAYFSPEQIKAEPIRPQSDIYCLGVMLYELLTGQKPFNGPTPVAYLQQHLETPLPSLAEQGDDLPASLDPVIQRATAKEPAGRYPDILSLLEEFRQAVGLPTAGVELAAVSSQGLVDLENPYKGLRPFGEADAVDFFGRDTLIQTLLGRMGETGDPAAPAAGQDLARFLAILGPSGSGKSSMVKAGLVPALRQGGLPDSENWFIVEMLPGTHPLEEVEAALLRVAVNPPESLLPQLREDERGLLRAVRRILPADDRTELVLVIDQFEELFTLCSDETVRGHLLDSLVTAVLEPRSRLRVIITLRADFTDRPLQYVDFGELVRQRTEFVLPLTPDEMEEVITKPAERVGLTMESGLPETIIQDVGDQPGTLPLLQYTLTELFERRAGRMLTLGAYQASGGVRGALASRADKLYANLDEAGQQAAHWLFLRLITLGEVTGDGLPAPDTRRRVLRSELTSIWSPSNSPQRKEDIAVPTPMEGIEEGPNQSCIAAVVERVIDLYGRHRLLTFDRDPVTRGPTVEIAHEALIREWGRLRGWLEEDREFLLWQQRLRAVLRQWEASEQDEGALLRGALLAEAENWFDQRRPDLSEAERNFIQTSLDLRKQKTAEHEAQRQRELETAKKLAKTEKARAAEQARAMQQLKRGTLLLAGVLVIAIILAAVAFIARQQAEAQQQLTFSRELAAAALSNIDVDPERSILLALEGLSTAHTLEAENALHTVLLASRVEHTLSDHSAAVEGVAYHPDGTRFATCSDDGTIKLWDSAAGHELLTLSSHAGPVFQIDYSPDGKRLASASLDGTAKVWDVQTGETLFTLSGHTDAVGDVAFSPDGKYLATTSDDKTAKVWDAGQVRLTLSGYQGFVNYVTFSPDGNLLAAGGEDGTVKIWDVATLLAEAQAASADTAGRELVNLPSGGGSHNGSAFSPDGKLIATGTESGLVKVWDVEASTAATSGQELLTLRGHTAPVAPIAFSPDGTRLASGSFDGTAKVWDVESGLELFTLVGHTGPILSIAFSPDGSRLLTPSWDGTAKVWRLSPERELITLAAHRGLDGATAVAFSLDGTRLATSGNDGTVKIWGLDMSATGASGKELSTVVSHTAPIWDVAFSPDGTRLAAASDDGTAKIWDTTSDRELFTLSGHAPGLYDANFNGVTGIDFSPDGRHLATSGDDGTARIWDATTGQELLVLQGHSGDYNSASPFLGATDVAFNPAGSRLATAGDDDTARIWDAASGELLLTLTGHQGDTSYVAFSQDGTRLATASMDATAKVWNAESGELLHTMTGHSGPVYAAPFSPDGTRLATASLDGTAKVWDAETGEALLTLSGHIGTVENVTFSPDGTRLITSGQDGTVRVYVLPIEELVTVAQSRVTRALTTEECQQFLHLDECPTN
jgi:WD40 repeat protein